MNILFPKIGTNLSLDKLNYDIHKNQFNYEVNIFLYKSTYIKIMKNIIAYSAYTPF